jgi:hypothetical protein
MIQRIQTVYLFISALLIILLLTLDFAEIVVNGRLLLFNARGIIDEGKIIISGMPVLGFIILIALLHVAVIFMYKNRIRQIRIIAFTIILLLGLFGTMLYFLHSGFEKVDVAYKIPMTFPVVAVILDYLAIRAIGKDEALVRSLDRIR